MTLDRLMTRPRNREWRETPRASPLRTDCSAGEIETERQISVNQSQWLTERWKTVRGSKRAELQTLFVANRPLFKAYVLREQLDRLWTYKTRPGVINFLLGWIRALRWQRLPEMERLGDFLFRHVEGIAAYCNHPVRFGVVEAINTTIKAVLRRAPGMRDDDMLLLKLNVFDRFSQHGDRGPAPRAGLGLGLALVREMVLAHRGTVTAASPGQGQGSTFLVTLPLSLDRARYTAVQSSADRNESVETIASLRILVVDDESDVRDMLMLMLESRGARVQLAASAAEALRLINSTNTDLLLADLTMPGEDGLSLIRNVRAAETTQRKPRLPAIAVTAYASASDRDQALMAGYDSHVAKPVDPHELLRVIAMLRKPHAV